VQIMVTQFVRPDGHRRQESVSDMPDSLAPILEEIAKAGLDLTAEVLTSGEVSFTLACDEYACDFDIEICENGPGEMGTKAGLARLIERFDKKKFQVWLQAQKEADDGCGVGWGV